VADPEKVLKDQQERFLAWLNENGYSDARLISRTQWAALFRFAFTSAIIVGDIGDFNGYSDRWCYSSLDKAKAALDAWGGDGEPTGWHRHPGTGRRVDEEGRTYVAR
jgi:hypothetical protein